MTTGTLREQVATEVRAELGRQRMSQSALARALGMSQPALNRRMTGELPFDIDLLERIGAQLDVPVTRFLATADRTSRFSRDSPALARTA